MQNSNETLQLLSADQMQQVDRNAAASGLNTFELMLNAGRCVAEHVLDREQSLSLVFIVAGGGNNGGDGYVAATQLRTAGVSTVVLAVGSPPAPGSDAYRASQLYQGPVLRLARDAKAIPDDVLDTLRKCDLLVDALFGAGLHHETSGIAARLIVAINKLPCPVVAVDLPSGLDGNDNIVKGDAIQASSTVTFFLAKPAHYLFPGRALCGELVIRQIGLDHTHLPSETEHLVQKNDPQLYLVRSHRQVLHD